MAFAFNTIPPQFALHPIHQALQAKAAQHFPKHPAIKSLPVLQNKHLVMWSLVSGAVGMFIGAGMGGIKGNEQLRDIYDRRTGGSLTEQQVRASQVLGIASSRPSFALVDVAVAFFFFCSRAGRSLRIYFVADLLCSLCLLLLALFS